MVSLANPNKNSKNNDVPETAVDFIASLIDDNHPYSKFFKNHVLKQLDLVEFLKQILIWRERAQQQQENRETTLRKETQEAKARGREESEFSFYLQKSERDKLIQLSEHIADMDDVKYEKEKTKLTEQIAVLNSKINLIDKNIAERKENIVAAANVINTNHRALAESMGEVEFTNEVGETVLVNFAELHAESPPAEKTLEIALNSHMAISASDANSIKEKFNGKWTEQIDNLRLQFKVVKLLHANADENVKPSIINKGDNQAKLRAIEAISQNASFRDLYGDHCPAGQSGDAKVSVANAQANNKLVDNIVENIVNRNKKLKWEEQKQSIEKILTVMEALHDPQSDVMQNIANRISNKI